VVAWYLLVSSCALYDAIDGLEQLLPSATASPASTASAASFRCANHECGCASREACRQRCCCEDDSSPRRPDAPRRSGAVHLLAALACHGGSHGGAALVPSLDPAVVAPFTLVIPPRVHAAVEVLASTLVAPLDGDALDKVPIATA
jgi:hypothetical protein